MNDFQESLSKSLCCYARICVIIVFSSFFFFTYFPLKQKQMFN